MIKGFTRRNAPNCQRNCSFFHHFPLISIIADGLRSIRHQTKCKSLAALFRGSEEGLIAAPQTPLAKLVKANRLIGSAPGSRKNPQNLVRDSRS